MSREVKENNLKGLLLLSLGVFFIWLIALFSTNWWFGDWAKSAPFGDSFGAINALFSGLALGGIIYTIFLQKKELGLQRKELRATREEFKIQNRTLRLQRFESTFFNLLSLHHQITDSIDYSVYKNKEREGLRRISKLSGSDETVFKELIIINGRDVFAYHYKSFYSRLQRDKVSAIDDLHKKYNEYWKNIRSDFSHYFRNLYRIVKLVDTTEFHTYPELNIDVNDITNEDQQRYINENYKSKYKYASIIRAQLSDYELLWLFYNCLRNDNAGKFKSLIERYSLFKNLPIDDLHNSELIDKFKPRTFGKYEDNDYTS